MKSYQKKESKVKESIAILDQEKLLDTTQNTSQNGYGMLPVSVFCGPHFDQVSS